MKLHDITNRCYLYNVTDDSGPWIVHVEPDGEIQLLLMAGEDVEDVIVLPAHVEDIHQQSGDDTWQILNAENEGQ